MKEDLKQIQDEFIQQWGILGSQWGINRTMAQIHALLMTTDGDLSTDEVMDILEISRGNAHTNLKDLVGWNLIKVNTRKGDRKEYFEAKKDVWDIFKAVTEGRLQREIKPALEILTKCEQESSQLEGKDADQFNQMMGDLREFVSLGVNLSPKITKLSQNSAIKLALKTLS